MPAVSVVIPSYNHAAYIGEAVDSVLAQTFTDWELIIVDDGSEDASLDILAGYTDSRITVLSQENQGAHAALNRGLETTQGRYISILNSDDVYEPERLDKLLGIFKQDESVVLTHSFIQVIEEKGHKLGVKRGYFNLEPWLLDRPALSFRAGDDYRSALLTENYLGTTSNFLFRAEVIKKMGGFRPLRFTHDWDFALRLLQHGELYLFPEPLLKYRIHDTNTIRTNKPEMIFEICWCLAMHLPRLMPELSNYDQESTPKKVQALLNSIYTYGAEKVLSVLLLQEICEHPQQALDLLEPANECRTAYLDFIEYTIHSQQRVKPSLVTKIVSRINGLLHQ